ncbi:hypothetical protein QTG54_009850 [Skeletonema marinoi]|uniref:Uncharacterized protein n=1 Tax=Skeletonema marinoi TaxID=267567 RepID=A0AAD8Y4H0_9STRA|nr:hypothetical protein QTG54_009850 [Skeletonema marinoi]
MLKMIRTSTNTATTTCDGTAIDGSDDPLTPTKLMISDSNSTAELSPFHDVTSTPSSPSKKTTTADGDTNTIVQDCPVSSAVIDIDGLCESALGLSKLEGKKAKRDLYRVLFGCMFAYVVLGIWETGSSDDTARQRLSSIAKPILKRRQAKNANIFQRALLSVIVLLPAVYVVLWTVFGLWCFIYSISAPDGSSGPLFYTGEVWLGITIRASYTVFGVSDSASPSKESGHSQRAQQNVDVDEETGLLQKNYT